MGKRSSYNEQRPKDFWSTIDPGCMVEPFVGRIEGKTYYEPCVGTGDLVRILASYATCKGHSDVRDIQFVPQLDALDLTEEEDLQGIDLIITNPPYKWGWLQPLLDHLPTLKPTWLLLPADFMHNKRSGPYMKKCLEVISIGRMYWVIKDDKKIKGTDNYCWYLFVDYLCHTRFIGR